MKSIRRAVGFAALVLELGLLSGCGMAPKAEAPSSGAAAPAAESAPTSLQGSSEEQEPATLADAEAMLERARADLDRLALNEPGAPPAAAGAAAPPAPATAAPTPAPSRDEGRRADKSASSADVERPQAKEASACETACKAFSSLSRASDAVCRLDSDGGKRCERARQIQQDASHRVASCGCSK